MERVIGLGLMADTQVRIRVRVVIGVRLSEYQL